jgi:lysophospholipase L1-like esterase
MTKLRVTCWTPWLLLALTCPLLAQDTNPAEGGPKPHRFEANIERFEKQDAEHPPPQGEVLFLGSSSIVGWNLKHWFPELVALNRGFGGSKIADSIHFFDRVVVPYAPKTIVFYAGDNDIGGGMTPEAVAADFKAFAELLTAALPDCELLYVSIKPQIQEANARIAEMCEANERFRYVELGKLLLDDNGEPRPELFKDDQLHLKPAGYAIWSAALAPLLETTAATE